MTRHGPALVPAALIVVALLIGGLGCSDDSQPTVFNQRPTTDIVDPILSGEEAVYNLHVRWKGYDEDGTIAGFEVAIDDTADWFFTSRFDSEFVFRSSECCVPDTSFPGGVRVIDSLYTGFHTLFVRAIDDLGAEDLTPDRISFTSTTVTPETRILRGPAASGALQNTATTVILEWEGLDADGTVAGYQYRLITGQEARTASGVTLPNGPDDPAWTSVGADCTIVRFTNLSTSAFPGDTRGFHRFSVFAIDNAGASERTIDPILNFRRWESVPSISGFVRVSSNIMGSRTGLSTVEGQIFEGTRLFFDWLGNAELYGGQIQCYQYAFDQQDVFSACDEGTTHYPPGLPDFVPRIGSHTLFVNAFDDAGQTIRTAFSFVVLSGPRGIDPSERKVLYIDDYNEGTNGTGQLWPRDAVEESFWSEVLAGFNVSKFDAETQGDVPTSRIIGSASTLVWYVDGDPQLENSNIPGPTFRNPLGPYINAGGNVILCGALLTDALTPDNNFDPRFIENPGCPHEPRQTYGGAGGVFALNWFPAFCDTGLSFVWDVLDVSSSYNNPARDALDTLVTTGEVLPDGSVLPTVGTDYTKRGFLPTGEPIMQFGLEECEQYKLRDFLPDDPQRAIPLWYFQDVTGELKRPCGVYVPADETKGRGHVVILGFPPYFFRTDEMQRVFETFLKIFGEPFQGPS